MLRSVARAGADRADGADRLHVPHADRRCACADPAGTGAAVREKPWLPDGIRRKSGAGAFLDAGAAAAVLRMRRRLRPGGCHGGDRASRAVRAGKQSQGAGYAAPRADLPPALQAAALDPCRGMQPDRGGACAEIRRGRDGRGQSGHPARHDQGRSSRRSSAAGMRWRSHWTSRSARSCCTRKQPLTRRSTYSEKRRRYAARSAGIRPEGRI